MHIEQAFGVLVARWGILWTPLKYDLRRSTRVVEVALKLHNLCIEEQEECIKTCMDGDESRQNVGWNICRVDGEGDGAIRQ